MQVSIVEDDPVIAKAITDKEGDYVLALTRNQPTLHDEVAAYFADPATTGLMSVTAVEKDHGRIETRTTAVSHAIDWLTGDRRHPGEHRFPGLASLIQATTQVECKGKITHDTRYFIASARLSAERAAEAIRNHWGIESMHWVLDVIFKEDQSRLRRGHGAQNMALVRRLAFNMVRAGKGKRSIKTARKAAGWSTELLQSILKPVPR